jgi:hypothetical protein
LDPNATPGGLADALAKRIIFDFDSCFAGTIDGGKRLLWVNRVGLTMSTTRPVYPQLRKYFGVAANRCDGLKH